MGDIYLDLKAKTSEAAMKAAMIEFGVQDVDELSVEVLQEPETGFLGRVTSRGVYRVTKKAAKSQRSRQRNRNGGKKRSGAKPKQSGNRERTERKSAKNDGTKGGNRRPERPNIP